MIDIGAALGDLIPSGGVAIDLGTSSTILSVKGRGVVLEQPSVVAVRERAGRRTVFAVGAAAKAMVGRHPPEVSIIHPLRDGVISDVGSAQTMIRLLLRQGLRKCGLAAMRPRVMISAPAGATLVEKRAIKTACFAAGARSVTLISESVAAAIGADLPVHDSTGCMIVDFGHGTTEIALLCLSGPVHTQTVRLGGAALDEAIIGHLRRKHNILIGEATAEQLKIGIGAAVPPDDGCGRVARVRGRSVVSGLPVTVDVSEQDICEAISETLRQIVVHVVSSLENTAPELAADVWERGITLSGGGALLTGLADMMQAELGLRVNLAHEPTLCVAKGCLRVLSDRRSREILELHGAERDLAPRRPKRRQTWLLAGEDKSAGFLRMARPG